MAEVIMWDFFSNIILGITVLVLIIGGFLYFAKGREKEAFNERMVMFGYSGSLFCFACHLIFHLLFLFFLPGVYRDNAFYVNVRNINIIALIMNTMVDFFYYLSFLLFILVFELNFKRTRYILTIIGIFMILLYIMLPIGSELENIPFIYFVILFTIILITYTKWSQVEYRIISSYLLMGYFCFSWSAIFSAWRLIYRRNFVPVWFGALLYCIGAIFMVLPILMTHENISCTLMYSVVLNSFMLCFMIFGIWLVISSGIPIFPIIIILIFMAFIWYIQYTTLNSIKSFGSEQVPSGVEVSQLNILGMLVRPQKLTEEEVTVSKEKKICLVCKGKISRENYMCPDCGALYCVKCSRTLVDLENMCWVCETPFDESKPSKPFKEEEKELDIEISKESEKKPVLENSKKDL